MIGFNLLAWLQRRYRPWDKAIDPRDETLTVAARKHHFEMQLSEQVVLRDGAKTEFGRLLVRSLIDNLHDIEVREVWTVGDFSEFVRIRERRVVLFELLNMIGSSEQRMRDIERIIEGLDEEAGQRAA